MKKIIFLFGHILLIHAFNMQGQTADTISSISCFNCCRPDALAPAGIMTDHVHEKGKFGIAYSYMNMQMQGNMSGTSNLTDAQIFNSYMMAPAKMNMQMHMLMPMYGITNRLTVMAMINYNINYMSMHMMPMDNSMMNMPGMTMSANTNMPTTCKSSGFGDTKIYVLYNLLHNCCHRLILGAGISLPTGSISAKGATMQDANEILPYNMQLGTGTYNMLPSLVYVLQKSRVSFGTAFNANIKPGVNERNYCFGNEFSLSPWLAYKVLPWMSFSLRAEAYRSGGIYGYDADINQSSGNDPSANIYNYGAQQRINTFAGMNLYGPAKFLKGMRLLLEYGMPVYQNLQGLPNPLGDLTPRFQMPVKSVFTGRLQYNF